MDNSFEKFYGRYEIPDEIYKLRELDKELRKMNLALGLIGLRPTIYNDCYQMTPPDLIPFANTGGAGIHFGFLTEFGQVPNLYEAPIVCITPTDDPPIRYIAHNLKDFLNLVGSIPYSEILESLWANPSEQYLQTILLDYSQDETHFIERRKKVLKAFQETFDTQLVDVVHSLKQANKDHLNTIYIPTSDGLGVLGSEEKNLIYAKYPFNFGMSIDDIELQKMKDYLNLASKHEKLAFIRDAFYYFVLTPEYEEKLYYFVIDLMESLNLQDEVQRMYLRIMDRV